MRDALLIFTAILILFVPVSTQMLELTEEEQLDARNREFYAAMLEQAAETDTIPLEALVPVKWDRVIAFDAYAGADEMYRLAGGRFSEALSSGGYNEMVSLIFMYEGEVTYFVHEVYAPHVDAFYSDGIVLCNDNEAFLRSEMPYLYVNLGSGFAQVRAGNG